MNVVFLCTNRGNSDLQQGPKWIIELVHKRSLRKNEQLVQFEISFNEIRSALGSLTQDNSTGGSPMSSVLVSV